MAFVEIILLALSLCVDTLVVSMGGSMTPGKSKFVKMVPVALTFGFMQTAFLFIGWVLGHSIVSYVDKFSGIVAFVLLLYIGVTMIVNGVRKGGKDEAVDLSGAKSLLLASVATSIDASAVGVSLAMAEISFREMYLTLGSVFVTTMLAAMTGIFCGSRIGMKYGKPAQIAGGVVLIAIGLKIMLG